MMLTNDLMEILGRDALYRHSKIWLLFFCHLFCCYGFEVHIVSSLSRMEQQSSQCPVIIQGKKEVNLLGNCMCFEHANWHPSGPQIYSVRITPRPWASNKEAKYRGITTGPSRPPTPKSTITIILYAVLGINLSVSFSVTEQ